MQQLDQDTSFPAQHTSAKPEPSQSILPPLSQDLGQSIAEGSTQLSVPHQLAPLSLQTLIESAPGQTTGQTLQVGEEEEQIPQHFSPPPPETQQQPAVIMEDPDTKLPPSKAFQSNLQSPLREKRPRNKWSQEEDDALRNILSAEELPWKSVAERMTALGHIRDSKQCRDRWCNFLKSLPIVVEENGEGVIATTTVGNQDWTEEDDKILFLAVNKYGPKWAKIVRIPIFQTRTQNQLKNRYYHSIDKRKISNATSVILLPTRRKGRPARADNDSSQHRSQTVIPFIQNP